MRHLLLIDPLERLNIKKDSSLVLAHQMKEAGLEVYVFFETDFSIHNQGTQIQKVYSFEATTSKVGFYLEKFELTTSQFLNLTSSDVVHMRLDPPFDSRYLRILWMLDHWHSMGIKVMNSPRGIMQFNEKLFAYRSEHATPSFVGTEIELARHFIKNLKQVPQYIVLKPMDLYSGIGVEKLSIGKWEERFIQKTRELSGPVIIQPFVNEVSQGEIRSIYFKGKELGSILKIPKEGEFLSNIAQGASFIPYELSVSNRRLCENVSKELAGHGVDWIAFDILGDSLQEVNVTCPGLLVEVSFALKENLALKIINLI